MFHSAIINFLSQFSFPDIPSQNGLVYVFCIVKLYFLFPYPKFARTLKVNYSLLANNVKDELHKRSDLCLEAVQNQNSFLTACSVKHILPWPHFGLEQSASALCLGCLASPHLSLINSVSVS